MPEPKIITLNQLGEEFESKLIKLEDVTITEIKEDSSSKGYDVLVEKDAFKGVIRVDKYLNPFIETSFFEVGSTIDITSNLGQYQTTYQIMIRSEADVLRK